MIVRGSRYQTLKHLCFHGVTSPYLILPLYFTVKQIHGAPPRSRLSMELYISFLLPKGGSWFLGRVVAQIWRRSLMCVLDIWSHRKRRLVSSNTGKLWSHHLGNWDYAEEVDITSKDVRDNDGKRRFSDFISGAKISMCYSYKYYPF